MMDIKKRIIISSIIIVVFTVIIIGASYAYYTSNVSILNPIKNGMNIGTTKINILYEDEDQINVENMIPGDSFDKSFTLTNQGSTAQSYKIVINNLVNEFERYEDITYILTENGKEIASGILPKDESNNELSKVLTIGVGESKTYKLTVIYNNVDANQLVDAGKVLSGKIYVKFVFENNVGSGYKEIVLNGTDPVIKGNLVPVIISDTGVVTKADTQSEWYSYENKRWANAVILNNDTNYNNGDVIPEENIESYFVWIPKYKYKLWNIGTTPGYSSQIDIVFTTVNTVDNNTVECITPGWNEEAKAYDGSNVSGANGSCDVGEYMTHPAFISMKTNGLWVGKFETGNNGGKIQIKPNVNSWRSINVSNMYTTSYNYNRVLDSHMMKNTEWGAVAYLTNSKYGRCENGTCTEITINSNSSFVTGMANNATGYFSSKSTSASTTGNYTGIYDMNGGAYEYVMGVMKESTNTTLMSGSSASYNSGFNGPLYSGSPITNGIDFPDAKYMDVYNYNTNDSDSTRRILGDATAETKGWNDDRAEFVITHSPWFIRGGEFGPSIKTGAFDFRYDCGYAYSNYGFRVTLAG